ncbi:alpha-mannosidase [Paenibacillus psychroresistens]|uniref:Alpha-mannosidase n=1 Tax=Paenibacillus psychroresistens TaxID=1778678 RepID=A0A6B8RF81_9BACL|nr:glycoside hydrolase family 38 C-terminal domain-containing protein [Paenibacillus psychroresistens]QGQ94016.1 alpha-mannosidase [Paenibacillus psychroresistens]
MKDTNERTLKPSLESIVKQLHNKRDCLEKAVNIEHWQKVAPDGSLQPQFKVPSTWDTALGSCSFKKHCVVPKTIEQISVIGSKLELLLVLTVGAHVKVNGETRYQVNYWADTQLVPILLTESVMGGESYQMDIITPGGDGLGGFALGKFRFPEVEEWIFQLDAFAEELSFSLFLIDHGYVSSSSTLDAMLMEGLTLVSLALTEGTWHALKTSIAHIRETWAPFFKSEAKQFQIHMVGHAHIDINWLWPMEETKDLIKRDFHSVLHIMEHYPQVKFSQSMAAYYQIIELEEPELFKRICEKVKSGNWDITAATWVEGDLNMAETETLVRQFLEAHSYIKEKFEISPSICWEPDTFGHIATLPQILKQAGIHYYYHSRPGGGEPLCWWEGLDGSRVLSYNDPLKYNGPIVASRMIGDLLAMHKRYSIAESMYVYGFGDHGGGMTLWEVEKATRLNLSPLLPQFSFAKSTDFFESLVRKEVALPVFYGEKNTIFEGCYTSHADIKRVNRQTEYALTAGETLQTMALIQTGQYSKDHPLETAWRRQCLNQFHDIICGCSIHSTYDEAIPAGWQAFEAGKHLQSSAMQQIASGIESFSTEPYLIAFNTLSWTRTGWVSLEIGNDTSGNTVQEGDEYVDYQNHRITIIRRANELGFYAVEIPPTGYKLFKKATSSSNEIEAPFKSVTTSQTEERFIMQNEWFTVEIDAESGTIVRFTDHRVDRELSHTVAGLWEEGNNLKGLMNLFQVLYETPRPMSAWKLGTISQIHQLVRGATSKWGQINANSASVIITHTYRDSEIQQEIRLTSHKAQLEFLTEVRWNEKAKLGEDAPFLRVSFNPNLIGPITSTYEIPFGSLERTANNQEVPALKWMDLSESGSGYGVGLINDCKYGHSSAGSTMNLSLIRSSIEPDTVPDIGIHTFSYALVPHLDYKEIVPQYAWEFNQPMTAQLTPSTNASLVTDSSKWPSNPEWSLFQLLDNKDAQLVESKHIIASACKSSPTDDDYYVVLRFYEINNQAGPLLLQWNGMIQSIWLVNLLEQPIYQLTHKSVKEGTLVELNVHPYEIISLKIYL